MPSSYRRPGVYLEESLLLNPSDVAGTTTVAAFVGLAGKGPVNSPFLVESWSDFYTVFGGFEGIPDPSPPANPNDITTTAFPTPPGKNFANLAALKADATYGDTHYAGPAFLPGRFVTLQDGSKAHTPVTGASSAWAVGQMTGTGLTVPLAVKALSYLPYAVYTFFQNGGRFAWIVRAVATGTTGGPASADIAHAPDQEEAAGETAIVLSAISAGKWGNDLAYRLTPNDSDAKVFTLEIQQRMSGTGQTAVWESMETFPNVSIRGEIAGTRRVDAVVNDLLGGSRLVRVNVPNLAYEEPMGASTAVPLLGGLDPDWPDSSQLSGAAVWLSGIEGPSASTSAATSPTSRT